jgi:hypothetical protein
MIPINYEKETIGDWKIEPFNVDQKGEDSHNLRELFQGTNRFIKKGRYNRLCFKSIVVMSDTPAEQTDHIEFFKKAKHAKTVLINGLGIGMLLREILTYKKIEKIIIVEKNKEVIELTSKYFKDKRLEIVHTDAFKYVPNEKMDVVWHDIWAFIEKSNYKEMQQLRKNYEKIAKWQGCWCEKEVIGLL